VIIRDWITFVRLKLYQAKHFWVTADVIIHFWVTAGVIIPAVQHQCQGQLPLFGVRNSWLYEVGRESSFWQKGWDPLSAWSPMVAVPKSRGRQYRRNQRLFLIQSPGRYHVLTRLSGCIFVIMHVPLPALGQRQNISIQDTLQSNEISSIGLLFLLLIVALSIMCFLRGVVRYAYDRRLRNNKMTSVPAVTSSQESYVLKGESVISSNLVSTPPQPFHFSTPTFRPGPAERFLEVSRMLLTKCFVSSCIFLFFASVCACMCACACACATAWW
jgi:hypothetical protein